MGTAFGGLGLDVRGQAPVFEEAGYSLLGPLALNCSAPDEGNMHLLEAVASPQQQERYLRPLAAGEVRSAFAMTEPAPGAGSDPTMLLTTARRDGGDWVIDGRKHLITGAQGSAFSICMARTADEIRHDEGATMFLVRERQPGHARRAPDPDHGPGLLGRACRGRVRRLPRAGRGRARARPGSATATRRCASRPRA